MPDSPTLWIDALLARLRAGDVSAREELLAFVVGRLERLAHSMLRGQFGRVGRWVDTGDVLQNASLRLWKALAEVTPDSPLHFHRLASRLVRLELIDLARHYYGPQGLGARHESAAPSPAGPDAATPSPTADPPAAAPPPDRAAEAAEVHAAVGSLPEEESVVTDLVFYQGLSQEEAATLLGVDVRTVQRRWQRARRALGAMLAPVD